MGRGRGRVTAPGRRTNLVRFALWVILGLTIAWMWSWNYSTLHFGTDLAIPLRAADRWQAGISPYQAADFSESTTLPPYLYPPPVFLLLVPFTVLPRFALQVVWFATLMVVATSSLRRLGLSRRGVAAVLLWPPMFEPLVQGNVQVLLFGAMTALFFRTPAIAIDPGDGAIPAWRPAILATLIPAIKIGQPHAWLHVLGRRPRAALGGAVAVAFVVLATIPAVGGSTWLDWVAQLERAADQGWRLGGFALIRLVPPLGYAVTLLTSVAALLWRGRRAEAVVPLLGVVGASSLYIFGTIALLPALLIIRREAALVAAILISTSTYMGAWAGILLTATALFGAQWRPRWLESRAAT